MTTQYTYTEIRGFDYLPKSIRKTVLGRRRPAEMSNLYNYMGNSTVPKIENGY